MKRQYLATAALSLAMLCETGAGQLAEEPSATRTPSGDQGAVGNGISAVVSGRPDSLKVGTQVDRPDVRYSRHGGVQRLVISVVPTVPVPIRLGTQVSFRVESNVAGYAGLYLVDPSGRVTVLGENMVLTGSLDYPLPADGVTLTATQPVGNNRVILLVTQQPIAGFSGYDTLSRPVSLAASENELRSGLNRIVRGRPRNSWAMEEISVRVVG